MEKLKNISLFIVIAFFVTGASQLLESSFLIDFLEKNLITILIALLAINTTTGSVVMTKLREISDTNGTDFTATIRELKASIIEQVVSIVVALVILIALGSKIVLSLHSQAENILDIVLVAVFVSSLYNLYDTANSIFVILNHENDRAKSK